MPSETIDFSKVGDKKLAVTVYSLKSPNFMRVCGSRSACTISSMVGEKESKKKSTGCERIFKNGATFNHRSEVCFESEGEKMTQNEVDYNDDNDDNGDTDDNDDNEVKH